MAATDLEELADAVDRLERETDDAMPWMRWDEGYTEMVEEYIAAKDDYFAALRKPWFDESEELERAKFVRPSKRRVDRLCEELEEARRHLATFDRLCRWSYTDAEWLRAQAAEEAAQGRHEFFYTAYWHAFGDRQAGIKDRRLPSRVVDGVTYVRTGFKKIGGERRELWEKVI